MTSTGRRTIGSTGASGTAATDRLAYHRFAAEMLRARGVLLIACSLWLVVGIVLDLLVVPVLGRGGSLVPMIYRLCASGYQAAVLVVLFRTPLPPPRLTVPLVAAIFPVTALALTVISARVGGLTSPYATGLFAILMAQALGLPQHWRRGAALAFLTASIYPAGMLFMSRFDPVLDAQLNDRAAVASFVTVMAVVGACAVLVAWGGHIVWSLRQSVFESKSIGRYRLSRRIGKGGMGEVWRALDKATRTDVALKILSPEQGRNPAAIARFEREIQATAELAHPGVVRIHDWGVTDDGVWYYAMELLDGIDLATLVKRHGQLPPGMCVHIGVQCCHAIALAHERGIVHRDLTPGNVFVLAGTGELDRVKVLDFGVARVGGDDGLTQAGAVMGTPGYIAPEVVAGGQAGIAADVFGLAATIHFALTGRNPRDAAGKPPSALVAGVPLALDDVLVSALDPDPARRPASAAELGLRLEATGLGRGAGGYRLDLPPTDKAPTFALEATQAAVHEPEPVTHADAPAARNRGDVSGA